MNRQKSIWRRCLGRGAIRRLEILILAVISIARVDSAQWVPHPDPVWTHYATNVGGIERFILQDGTGVDLNTGSAIKARFTGGQREVVLIHGEALFTVVHRTNWPFSVRAGGAMIHAVGTKCVGARKARNRRPLSQHRPGQLHCDPRALVRCPSKTCGCPRDRSRHDLPDWKLCASTAAMQLVQGPIDGTGDSVPRAAPWFKGRILC